MNYKKGHTLIELIIIILVLAILSFVFGNFIFKATDAWIFVKTRDSAMGSARYSMNRVLLEIRRIQSPTQLSVLTSTECKFKDIDSNDVDFKQIGADLYRNTDMLASGLLSPGGLRFSYFTDSGTSTTINLNVRVINVKLSFNKFSQVITLESSVRIRNI